MIKNVKKEYRIAVIAYILAIAVHITGYFTNLLYIIGWLMWIPALVLLVRSAGQIHKDGYIAPKKLSRKRIFTTTEFVCLVLIGIYAIFSLLYNSYILRNGGGEFRNGIYYLIDQGERIREITKEEYSSLLLAEYRLYTGHILFFYGLLLTYLRIRKMGEE